MRRATSASPRATSSTPARTVSETRARMLPLEVRQARQQPAGGKRIGGRHQHLALGPSCWGARQHGLQLRERALDRARHGATACGQPQRITRMPPRLEQRDASHALQLGKPAADRRMRDAARTPPWRTTSPNTRRAWSGSLSTVSRLDHAAAGTGPVRGPQCLPPAPRARRHDRTRTARPCRDPFAWTQQPAPAAARRRTWLPRRPARLSGHRRRWWRHSGGRVGRADGFRTCGGQGGAVAGRRRRAGDAGDGGGHVPGPHAGQAGRGAATLLDDGAVPGAQPKAWAFLASLATLGVAGAGTGLGRTLLVFATVSLACSCLWLAAGGRLGRWLPGQRRQRLFNRGMAMVLAAMAVHLCVQAWSH